MRTVHRLLGLVRTYGPEAVEAACVRALELDVVDVTKIARMLEQARERERPAEPAKVVGGPGLFARDAAESTPSSRPGPADEPPAGADHTRSIRGAFARSPKPLCGVPLLLKVPANPHPLTSQSGGS